MPDIKVKDVVIKKNVKTVFFIKASRPLFQIPALEHNSLMSIRNKTAKIEKNWDTVLCFPSLAAAITIPPAAHNSLIPVINNSRLKIIIIIQAGISLSSTKARNAASTRILSAMGSMSLPKLVIKFLFLAIRPSK